MQRQQIQVCHPNRLRKLYYVSNNWLKDRHTIESSRYTSFCFFVYKNCNAGLEAISVLAIDILDWLQILVFVFLLVKIII